jgi:hypothetical protein
MKGSEWRAKSLLQCDRHLNGLLCRKGRVHSEPLQEDQPPHQSFRPLNSYGLASAGAAEETALLKGFGGALGRSLQA